MLLFLRTPAQSCQPRPIVLAGGLVFLVLGIIGAKWLKAEQKARQVAGIAILTGLAGAVEFLVFKFLESFTG